MGKQHETVEYRRERTRLGAVVRAGRAFCVEPVCKMTDRWISPADRWSVSHDPSGTVILGPSHLTCNLSEAAIRGNKMRRAAGLVVRPPVRGRRWVL